MKAYGKKVWLIPDNYLNSVSLNDWVSHEAVCVINSSDTDAVIDLTLLFEDNEPMKGFKAECKSMHTNHIRLDKIISEDGKKIPRDTPYAMIIESNTPIVVQYSRLDTSHKEMALMTTIAYPTE